MAVVNFARFSPAFPALLIMPSPRPVARGSSRRSHVPAFCHRASKNSLFGCPHYSRTVTENVYLDNLFVKDKLIPSVTV